MNKTELITLLRDPSKLTSDDLEELEHLVADDPYFLSARLLLAKGSKQLNHPKTKKRIASAAIYSTDRGLLKKYLSGNLFFLSQPTPSDTEEIETIKAVETPSREEKVDKVMDGHPRDRVQREEHKKPKVRGDVRPSALMPDHKRPTPIVPGVPRHGDLDSLLDELQRDMENLKASRSRFAEVQSKIEEDEAVSAALYKAKKKKSEARKEEPLQEKQPPKQTTTPPIKKEKESKDLDEDIDKMVSQKLAELAKKKEKKQEEERASEGPERDEQSSREPRFSRFSSRSYLKNLDEIPEFDLDDEEEEEPKKKEHPLKSISPSEQPSPKAKGKIKTAKEDTTPKASEKKATSTKKSSKEKKDAPASKTGSKDKSDDGKEDREKQKEIIEKFIKEAPSIKYNTEPEMSTTDLAEQSTAWDANIASEYLAEIYLTQGNKKRAVEIYEALALKYPEKTSYFADLISKID